MIAAPLKPLAESLLAHGGPAAVSRLLRRRDTLVLAYHNVVPDDAAPFGDRSLHLRRRDFAAQLELLGRTCEVVPLDGVATPRGRGGRPRVAVTFDDAYRGAVTLGVEELRRRGMPATVFVPPAFIGATSFWWDAVADPATGAPPGARDHLLTALRGDDGAIRAWAVAAGVPLRPVPRWGEPATEAELHAALRHPGLSLAPHSWSHRNLAALEEDEARDELERPLRWLRERFGAVVAWTSYPYGLATPAVERLARAAGYDGALRVDGGWISGAVANAYALPRFNVPAGISRSGFALRTAGIL